MRQQRGRGRLDFPDLEERFDEEAVTDAQSLLRRDWETSSATIIARIRGIQSVERIRAWVAVENRMRGREHVFDALKQRKRQIEADDRGDGS